MNIDSNIFDDAKENKLVHRVSAQEDIRARKFITPIFKKRLKSKDEDSLRKVTRNIRIMDKTMSE